MQYIPQKDHYLFQYQSNKLVQQQQYQTPEKCIKDQSNLENLVNTNSTHDSLSPFSFGSPATEIPTKVIFEEEFQQKSETKQQIKPFYTKSPQCINNTTKSSRTLCFDRFIPSRVQSNFQIALTDAHETQEQINNPLQEQQQEQQQEQETEDQNTLNQQNLFKSHVLSVPQSSKKHEFLFSNKNILSYKRDTEQIKRKQDILLQPRNINIPTEEDILNLQQEKKRRINTLPYKILDAPQLSDDFYLNVLDWSLNNNILAVGLSQSTFLWSPLTSKVTKLIDLNIYDQITSLQWANSQQCILAIGTSYGQVQLWDTNKFKIVNLIQDHTSRVGTLSWNNNLLSSGSRDKSILTYDIRQCNKYLYKHISHNQEVCGLKWSPDTNQLASGGNDNKLLIWQLGYRNPLHNLKGHIAAIKALTWSTQQDNILLSGGGSADRSIRFWNTSSGIQLGCIQTKSQVCNLTFSRNSNEFVSAHGYSTNELNIWRYNTLPQKIATLTGHTSRVLYLSNSPDGSSIVTGAGDETLRFWNVFDNYASNQKSCQSTILPNQFQFNLR